MSLNPQSMKMDRLALALPVVPPQAVKFCPKCVVTKPVDMFSLKWCIECTRKQVPA